MDRRLYIFIFTYSILLAFLYSIPSGLENEWYSFYAYLDSHGAFPYVDVREGYPPLGFLVYMPLYYAFRFSRVAFSYGFRALNGFFLISTVVVLYFILEQFFEEGKALGLTLCYAVLPSVIIANTYSNDVVALLPASLAIYYMLRGRSLACGVFLGLATLCKGFPLLLIIPALIAFKKRGDRRKLLISTAGVLALLSLPFLMANPLAYISTYTHHGSRGPWETVWALVEGYYSHGGLLHPYFDKFFYHTSLLQFYSPSPYDHALYDWRFDLLPDLLILGELAIVLSLALIRLEDGRGAVSLCGLIYVGYMLFFKGYSTQFSVSTQLYALLAALDTPFTFIIPLEVAHLLQMVSWMGLPMAPMELVRDHHRVLLISSIIMRTMVFISLLLRAYRGGLEFSRLRGFFRGFASCLSPLDRWGTISVSAALLFAFLAFFQVQDFMRRGGMAVIIDGSVELSLEDWGIIELDGLSRGDQVLLRMYTRTGLEAVVSSTSGIRPLEKGLWNPYNLKGSFNESLLFFVADDGPNILRLRMRHPGIPFRVTDGLDGDLSADVSMEGSNLVLRLRDLGMDGSPSLFRLAYPAEGRVEEDFSLLLRYRIISGSDCKVLMDVFDETDEWLHTFEAPENFQLDKGHPGFSNLFGDDISLVAIVFVVKDGGSAEIVLEPPSIRGVEVPLYEENRELVKYSVLVERDFKPSTGYIASLTLSAAFSIAAALLILKRDR